MAKGVLNTTWGTLSRKKNYQVAIEDVRPENFDKIIQVRLDKGFVYMAGSEHPFKHVTGRLKPFLLAYARLYLLKKIIVPLEEKGFEIYQVNTDGFITNAKPEQMQQIYPLSNVMGDLKIEKELKGTHDIKHVRRIDSVEFDEMDI